MNYYYYIGKRTKPEASLKTIEKIQRYKNDKVIFIFDKTNYEDSFVPYLQELNYNLDFNKQRINEPTILYANNEDTHLNCVVMVLHPEDQGIFSDFPNNLTDAQSYQIPEPMCFILDTTYDLAQGKKNVDISNKIVSLASKGVYIDFPKFPWLNTDNINHIIEIATGSNEFNPETFIEVFKYQLSILQDFVDFQSSEKSISVKQSGKSYGYQKSAVRTAKEEEVKQKMIEYLTNPNYRNVYSDKELIDMVGTSRMTFYKYKRQLEEEGKI